MFSSVVHIDRSEMRFSECDFDLYFELDLTDFAIHCENRPSSVDSCDLKDVQTSKLDEKPVKNVCLTG